jgi:hypothetical protein
VTTTNTAAPEPLLSLQIIPSSCRTPASSSRSVPSPPRPQYAI